MIIEAAKKLETSNYGDVCVFEADPLEPPAPDPKRGARLDTAVGTELDRLAEAFGHEGRRIEDDASFRARLRRRLLSTSELPGADET